MYTIGSSIYVEFKRLRGDLIEWAELFTERVKPAMDALVATYAAAKSQARPRA